jgi:hypothetical protein
MSPLRESWKHDSISTSQLDEGPWLKLVDRTDLAQMTEPSYLLVAPGEPSYNILELLANNLDII